MPLAVDQLGEKSSDKDTQDAISKSIETCMREGGRSQEQCAAIAYEKARERTGKELNYGK